MALTYRSFRLTKNGVLKFSVYDSREFPKGFKSVSYEIPPVLFEKFSSQESIFVYQLLRTADSGVQFTKESLVTRLNIFNNLVDFFHSKELTWVDLSNAFSHDGHLIEKEKGFDAVTLIEEFSKLHIQVLSKFIRN